MWLSRVLLRQGNYLGWFEKKTLDEVMARHAPMGDQCQCGEQVNIADWQRWIGHQYEVAFLAGRRQGPRVFE